MPVYFYDPPDRFVAGAVGQPGERIFYLQATSSGRVTSVVLEKFQVSLLAERIDELLDEVRGRPGGPPEVPAVTPTGLQDDAPLDLPLLEDFRVGAIALAWDGDGGMVVIEAQEESDEPVERETGGRGAPGRRVQRDAVLHDQPFRLQADPFQGPEKPEQPGEPGRLRLQAGRRRASAVGLSHRHAGGPRGRGLRRVTRGGLGCGPAHRAAGRAVRARHVPAVDRPRH